MAHNPPRPQGLSAAATRRIADEAGRRRQTPWSDLAELADRIEDQVKQGKRVVLLPETALIVADVLRRHS